MKRFNVIILVVSFMLMSVIFNNCRLMFVASAYVNKDYYTVYDENNKILFMRGNDVNEGDNYLSKDNKLYEIYSVDSDKKTAKAKFIKEEILPKYNVKSSFLKSAKTENNSNKITSKSNNAKAETKKIIGVYHTHNDESYYTPDGVDSVYGKGGIHDVGNKFVSNLNKLGIDTIYREDLHLPHNSGAYTRSQVTASALLNSGAQAIFDLHRDSTKRDYYLTKVNGKQMSSIRMVVGKSSANFEENKKFAYSIKSYADEVYDGLIKDIYFGKGNYNQQLSSRAMLFEMGCENIEKDFAIKSTEYLAKTLDVVLYGSDNASDKSLSDVSLTGSDGNDTVITGVVNSAGDNKVNSNETLIVVLSILGAVVFVLILVLIFSKKARYKVGRFFSELFAGIFGKRKKMD